MYYIKLVVFFLVFLASPVWADEEEFLFNKKNMEEMLQKMPQNEKFVALTFDDGPSRYTTPVILRILKEHGVHATFFMLGMQAHRYASLVEQVIGEGHEIGNHTYSHPRLTRRAKAVIESELQKTQDVLCQYSENIHWFRPPYGLINREIHQKALRLGMHTVLWTVDSRDWKRGSSQENLKNRVLKDVRPGSVILFHDIHARTAAALPEIIQALQNEGYEFVTMTEWLQKMQKISQASLEKKNEPASVPANANG